MKCKCGGDTTSQKVNVTHRHKKYKVSRYTCQKCSREFYLSRIYVPLRGTK